MNTPLVKQLKSLLFVALIVCWFLLFAFVVCVCCLLVLFIGFVVCFINALVSGSTLFGPGSPRKSP